MQDETRLRFFSSSDQCWATPLPLFEKLNKVFDFRLDPCAHPSTAKCRQFFTKEEDGLKQSWHDFGNAFVNPPFSREIGSWIAKSYEESQKGILVAMLIPARPDTMAWHQYCLPYAKILFIRGRISFLDQREDGGGQERQSRLLPVCLSCIRRHQRKELSGAQRLGNMDA